MKGISFEDKTEYENMELIKMGSQNPYHRALFVNEHIFKKTQTDFHRHEYMQINYVASGNGYCEFEDGTAHFSHGSCFIIPPYVPHRIVLANSSETVKIYEVEFLTDFIFPPSHEIDDMAAYSDFICLGMNTTPDTYSKHIITLSGSTREKVESIIADAVYEYSKRELGFETVLRSLILYLLTILGRKYSINENDDAPCRYKKHRCEILKCLDYIHKNYEKDISLNELSHMVNYSNSYFSLIFKSVTSKSFLEYLQHYRINKSMELLRGTDMLIIDIASSVGFNNVTNYNRMFKKIIGVSPTDYRRLK